MPRAVDFFISASGAEPVKELAPQNVDDLSVVGDNPVAKDSMKRFAGLVKSAAGGCMRCGAPRKRHERRILEQFHFEIARWTRSGHPRSVSFIFYHFQLLSSKPACLPGCSIDTVKSKLL